MKQLKQGITPGPFIETVILDRSRIYDPDHYAFNLPSLKNFSKLDLHPQVTFLVGENGSGKSTGIADLTERPFVGKASKGSRTGFESRVSRYSRTPRLRPGEVLHKRFGNHDPERHND